MAVVLLTIQGNTAPNIGLILKRNGVPIDLTGCTVKLIITNTETGAIINAGHQGCTVADALAGAIVYAPTTGVDFPAEGRLLGAAEITNAAGKVEELNEKALIIVGTK